MHKTIFTASVAHLRDYECEYAYPFENGFDIGQAFDMVRIGRTPDTLMTVEFLNDNKPVIDTILIKATQFTKLFKEYTESLHRIEMAFLGHLVETDAENRMRWVIHGDGAEKIARLFKRKGVTICEQTAKTLFCWMYQISINRPIEKPAPVKPKTEKRTVQVLKDGKWSTETRDMHIVKPSTRTDADRERERIHSTPGGLLYAEWADGNSGKVAKIISIIRYEAWKSLNQTRNWHGPHNDTDWDEEDDFLEFHRMHYPEVGIERCFILNEKWPKLELDLDIEATKIAKHPIIKIKAGAEIDGDWYEMEISYRINADGSIDHYTDMKYADGDYMGANHMETSISFIFQHRNMFYTWDGKRGENLDELHAKVPVFEESELVKSLQLVQPENQS